VYSLQQAGCPGCRLGPALPPFARVDAPGYVEKKMPSRACGTAQQKSGKIQHRTAMCRRQGDAAKKVLTFLAQDDIIFLKFQKFLEQKRPRRLLAFEVFLSQCGFF
jgi:hypothetical protein